MTESKKDFFTALRKKIRVEPDRAFDNRFWNKFDREFAPKPSRWQALWVAWNLRIALPVAAGLAIVAGVTLYGLRRPGDTEMLGEPTEFAMILENRDLFDELDLYAELDTLDLSDEEFEAVLSEVDGGEG